jgi:hypothetical protein
MSWQIELPIIIRTLINDVDEANQTYSDDRILQAIVVAAKYVQFDVNLEHKYTVNIATPNISPDPTDANDDIFISLVSLKSACLFDESTLRTKAALEGIRASLGPASLSVGGSLAGLKLIIEKGPCAAYEELTSHWDVKEATAIRAVLSPFVGNKFDARYLQTYTDRSRYFYS